MRLSGTGEPHLTPWNMVTDPDEVIVAKVVASAHTGGSQRADLDGPRPGERPPRTEPACSRGDRTAEQVGHSLCVGINRNKRF